MESEESRWQRVVSNQNGSRSNDRLLAVSPSKYHSLVNEPGFRGGVERLIPELSKGEDS